MLSPGPALPARVSKHDPDPDPDPDGILEVEVRTDCPEPVEGLALN
jgi:hypothetical protein